MSDTIKKLTNFFFHTSDSKKDIRGQRISKRKLFHTKQFEAALRWEQHPVRLSSKAL